MGNIDQSIARTLKWARKLVIDILLKRENAIAFDPP
jgi:hypothetical protein